MDEVIKHIVMWTFREQYYGTQVDEIRKNIKSGLEGLQGKIPGFIEIKVVTEPLQTSNCDLMLIATFESEEALRNYASHPVHAEVAKNCVDPVRAQRICMDYNID